MDRTRDGGLRRPVHGTASLRRCGEAVSWRTQRSLVSGGTGWPLNLVRQQWSVNFPVPAHNIDRDRRLAKPAIVTTIEGVRSGCAWRWSRSDTTALHVGVLNRTIDSACSSTVTEWVQVALPFGRRQIQNSEEISMARPPALKLAEVLAEIRMSPSAFYRLRARGQAPRMIKLPNGELRCRRADPPACAGDERDAPLESLVGGHHATLLTGKESCASS